MSVGIRQGFYITVLDFQDSVVKIMKLPKGVEDIEQIEDWLFNTLNYRDSQIQWMTSKVLNLQMELED